MERFEKERYLKKRKKWKQRTKVHNESFKSDFLKEAYK